MQTTNSFIYNQLMKIEKIIKSENCYNKLGFFTRYANLKGDILIKKINIFQAGENFIEITHIFI